jgi:hypothetical protein
MSFLNFLACVLVSGALIIGIVLSLTAFVKACKNGSGKNTSGRRKNGS